MRHYMNPFTMVLLLVGIFAAMKWQVTLIVIGVMFFDQCLHEMQPKGIFENPIFRLFGIALGIGSVLIGGLYLR